MKLPPDTAEHDVANARGLALAAALSPAALALLLGSPEAQAFDYQTNARNRLSRLRVMVAEVRRLRAMVAQARGTR